MEASHAWDRTNSPLPTSGLNYLHPYYQPLVRVPSNTSNHTHDSNNPYLADHSNHYSPQHSHAYPRQFSSSTQRQHTPVLYFKPEYGPMSVEMSDLPHVSAESTRTDYSDDGHREGMVEMDQEEVDAIIRNKRKVRDPKACYACHRRKVKCDRNLPCDSCVKRDHPELCSYERPTKKRRIALSNALATADGAITDGSERLLNSGPNIMVPKEQWERMNKELEQLRNAAAEHEREARDASVLPMTDDAFTASNAGTLIGQSDEAEREGVHAPSNQMGTMHLGSRSVLAYMIGNRSKATQDTAMRLLEENILPNLGLDNETTTYPFVDLWSTDSSMQDVSGLLKALPEDSLCREFWLTYRDIPCTIYPVVPDAEAFDQNLQFLLHNRADTSRTGADIDPDRPYGVSLSWLALLFAVLASGSQSTGRPAKERELTSQVYICCSYQALRMSNFLTHPSLETIQALLVIGNALSYNMNPGVSYVLLGMTLRSALSMGLHEKSQSFSEHENYLRLRIWWALAWQDSHFSVSYDRPSSSLLCMPDVPHTKTSTPNNRSYVESMSDIIKLTQEILRWRALNQRQVMNWAMITKYKDEVHRIWENAMPRLRNRKLCVAMTDHLERLALRLHCTYMISEICRPALKEDSHSLPTPTSAPTSALLSRSPPNASPVGVKRRASLSSSTQSPGGAATPQDPAILNSLRAECIKYLEQVVDTYVELRTINKFAARSWIGIQRSISAAFLLGVLPETKQEPRIIKLLTELEKGIGQSAIEDTGFSKEPLDLISPTSNGGGAQTDSSSAAQSKDSPLWVKSMTKSLKALSKLNAALADSKANMQQQFTPSNQQHSQQKQYQPLNSLPTPPMYNNNPVPPSVANKSLNLSLKMQQYPVMYQPQGQPPNRPGMNLPSQMIPGHIGIGPYTPDSQGSNNDWNHGNMTERALEYVQPGLWG